MFILAKKKSKCENKIEASGSLKIFYKPCDLTSGMFSTEMWNHSVITLKY